MDTLPRGGTVNVFHETGTDSRAEGMPVARRFSKVRAACVGVAGAVLLAVLNHADAGPVSGTITLNGQPFTGILVLPNGLEVRITAGRYRITLDPGTYNLRFLTNDGQEVGTRTVQSSATSLHQDISL